MFILCWGPLIWIPRGAAAWLELVFVQTLISGNTDCGLMSIPQPWDFPHVLKPTVQFRFSRVHLLQTEKCEQSCVSTLNIWVHSCSCFKLPTGPWINCFISESVPHFKGKLAYSHQGARSSLRGRMCLCALHSKSLAWAAACSYHCITKSRWKGKWPSH